MANDFSGDSRFRCILDFENAGDDLGLDKLGNHNWTVNPSGGSGMRSSSYVKEGSYNLFVDSDGEFLSLADISAANVFPYMSGSSKKESFICFWWRPTFNNTSYYIVNKYRAASGGRSFNIRQSSSGYINLLIGDADDDTFSTLAHEAQLTGGRTYHVQVWHKDGAADSGKGKIKIWGSTENDYIGSTATDNALKTMRINTREWCIAAQSGSHGDSARGYLDEIVFCNSFDITEGEADSIRAGTFGASSSFSSSSTSFSSSSSSLSSSSSSSTSYSFSSSSSSSSSLSSSSTSFSSSSATSVTLDSDFDNGNGIEESTFESPSGTFNIYTERDYPGSNWTDWFFFKLNNVNGLSPTIKVNYVHYTSPSYWSADHANVRPVWSYDGITWNRLSSIDSYSGGVLTFTLPEMTQSGVYVAMDVPYTWAMIQADMTAWGASAHCAVSELSYGGVTGSQGGRSIYHMRIEDVGSHYANKLHVVITCRAHSGEPQASWALKGMIDWILGSDANAVALREKIILDVFPCANPDGVYHGRLRAFDSQSPGGSWDGNRGWNTSGPNITLEPNETFLIHSKIHSVQSTVTCCIDLHSSNWTDVKLCEDAAGVCPRFGTTLETAIRDKVNTYDTGNYFDSDVLYRYDGDSSSTATAYRMGQGNQYGYPHILLEGGIYTTDGGAYPTSAQREAGGVVLLRSVLEALESASYSSTSFSSSSSSLSSSSSSSSESSSSSSSSSTSFSSSSFSSSSSSSSSTSFSFSSSSFSESCMLFVRTRHAVGAWTKTEQPCVRTRN